MQIKEKIWQIVARVKELQIEQGNLLDRLDTHSQLLQDEDYPTANTRVCDTEDKVQGFATVVSVPSYQASFQESVTAAASAPSFQPNYQPRVYQAKANLYK